MFDIEVEIITFDFQVQDIDSGLQELDEINCSTFGGAYIHTYIHTYIHILFVKAGQFAATCHILLSCVWVSGHIIAILAPVVQRVDRAIHWI